MFNSALVGLFLWFIEGNETPERRQKCKCCLGFRGEKWLVATSSRPSSKTIYFTGMQRTCAVVLRSNQQRQSGSSELYKCLINDG